MAESVKIVPSTTRTDLEVHVPIPMAQLPRYPRFVRARAGTMPLTLSLSLRLGSVRGKDSEKKIEHTAHAHTH